MGITLISQPANHRHKKYSIKEGKLICYSLLISEGHHPRVELVSYLLPGDAIHQSSGVAR